MAGFTLQCGSSAAEGLVWVPVLQHVGCREEVGFGQAALASTSCPVGAGCAISCGPGSCSAGKQELGPAERWLHTVRATEAEWGLGPAASHLQAFSTQAHGRDWGFPNISCALGHQEKSVLQMGVLDGEEANGDAAAGTKPPVSRESSGIAADTSWSWSCG